MTASTTTTTARDYDRWVLGYSTPERRLADVFEGLQDAISSLNDTIASREAIADSMDALSDLVPLVTHRNKVHARLMIALEAARQAGRPTTSDERKQMEEEEESAS